MDSRKTLTENPVPLANQEKTWTEEEVFRSRVWAAWYNDDLRRWDEENGLGRRMDTMGLVFDLNNPMSNETFHCITFNVLKDWVDHPAQNT